MILFLEAVIMYSLDGVDVAYDKSATSGIPPLL